MRGLAFGFLLNFGAKNPPHRQAANRCAQIFKMPKTFIEQSFDNLVSKIIWPTFKARAYKKIGNNFRCYDLSGWGKIVNFQKYDFNDKHYIQFTVNTGLYLPGYERFHCNIESRKKFFEPCYNTKKNREVNRPRDKWHELTDYISLIIH